MKKLFLAVALIAATLCVNAQTTWNFTTAPGTASTLVGSSLFNQTAPNDSTWGPTYTASGAEASMQVSGYPGLGVAYKNSTLTNMNIQFQYRNGFFQANGKDVVLYITGCSAGETISIEYSTKNAAPLSVEHLVNPALQASVPTASVLTFFAPNLTIPASEAGITSTATSDKKIVNLTATASGNVCIVAGGTTGFRIYRLKKGGLLAANSDAIASSLLSKVNDALVNPTNLEVEIYTVMGVKVLTSSASSIDVAGLASGFYVAKTAQGTLKFIK